MSDQLSNILPLSLPTQMPGSAPSGLMATSGGAPAGFSFTSLLTPQASATATLPWSATGQSLPLPGETLPPDAEASGPQLPQQLPQLLAGLDGRADQAPLNSGQLQALSEMLPEPLRNLDRLKQFAEQSDDPVLQALARQLSAVNDSDMPPAADVTPAVPSPAETLPETLSSDSGLLPSERLQPGTAARTPQLIAGEGTVQAENPQSANSTGVVSDTAAPSLESSPLPQAGSSPQGSPSQGLQTESDDKPGVAVGVPPAPVKDASVTDVGQSPQDTVPLSASLRDQAVAGKAATDNLQSMPSGRGGVAVMADPLAGSQSGVTQPPVSEAALQQSRSEIGPANEKVTEVLADRPSVMPGAQDPANDPGVSGAVSEATRSIRGADALTLDSVRPDALADSSLPEKSPATQADQGSHQPRTAVDTPVLSAAPAADVTIDEPARPVSETQSVAGSTLAPQSAAAAAVVQEAADSLTAEQRRLASARSNEPLSQVRSVDVGSLESEQPPPGASAQRQQPVAVQGVTTAAPVVELVNSSAGRFEAALPENLQALLQRPVQQEKSLPMDISSQSATLGGESLSRTEAAAATVSALQSATTGSAAAVRETPHQMQMNSQPQLNTPAWRNEVGEKAVWLSAQNSKVAEIQLDPPELGALKVRVQVNQDQVSLSFSSPHGAVRDALEQAMPRLREMFAEQGMTLADSSVSDQSGGQANEGRERAQSEFAGYDSGAAADGTPADAEPSPADGRAISLVDYYA